METALHIVYELLKPLGDLGVVPGWIVGGVFALFIVAFLAKLIEILRDV